MRCLGACVSPQPDSRSLSVETAPRFPYNVPQSAWHITGHHKNIFVPEWRSESTNTIITFLLIWVQMSKDHILVSYHWFQVWAQRCWKYILYKLSAELNQIEEVAQLVDIRGSSETFETSATFWTSFEYKNPSNMSFDSLLDNMPQFQNEVFEVNPVWVMFLLDS